VEPAQPRGVRGLAYLRWSALALLFVVPAYAGFVTTLIARRERVSFGRAPVVMFSVFALVVTGQALNPSLPNLLVGLIEMKVWLLYIPL